MTSEPTEAFGRQDAIPLYLPELPLRPWSD
jgi:hypothetical protein